MKHYGSQKSLLKGLLKRFLKNMILTLLAGPLLGITTSAAWANPFLDISSLSLDEKSAETKQKTIERLSEITNHLDWSPLRQNHSKYLFDPQDLQAIVRNHINLPLEEALPAIHQELQRRYPGKIMDHYRFIFNDAGAALGQVAILYASADEYLIFFGSPIRTGGFSGRYHYADFYDIMIEGEMSTVIEGQIKKQTYLPGDMAFLPRGTAKGYELQKSGWMLEYSRGKMIASFAFGVIGPALFITMDWESALAQVTDFGAAMLKSSR